jgi:hypothetical protein
MRAAPNPIPPIPFNQLNEVATAQDYSTLTARAEAAIHYLPLLFLLEEMDRDATGTVK